MKTKNVLVLIVLSFFVLQQPAFAVNGSKLIGVGAVSPAMGGTGAVEPQDTAGIMINPATVTKMGKRIDGAVEFAMIDAYMDTSQAALVNFRNTAGVKKSKDGHIWLPYFGFSNRLGDSDWYYGFASGIVSGLKVDYKTSRLSQLVTNNDFDKHIESYSMEFVPTVAYKPIEKLSLGVSGVTTLNYLKGDITTASFTETEGRNHGDLNLGIGFNVGAVYDICEYASVAFSFKSRRWNDENHKYDDVAKQIDGAPEYIFGLALKPIDNLLIESNAKFIDWTNIPILRKGPANHGYGWTSQWVFSVGAQYTMFERLKLRLGYNYGQSPIRNNVVYANALLSLISEHHLGVGLGYQITDRFSVDAGWVHTFKNDLTETGLGDAYSVNGKGSYISLAVDSFLLGFSYHFD
ncbi:MAG: outer membrane protein transport protein [Candidatus Omnitrophica bacterium]|nr:outer membrane protein transport protein [Candidatus Omnitrophota bacterium]